MQMSLEVSLEGGGPGVRGGSTGEGELDHLIRLMEDTLPGALALRVYGKGLLAMARHVRDQARTTSEFADKSGALRKSIKSRSRVAQYGKHRVPGGAAQVVVGGKDAYQGYIIEYGRVGGPGYPASRPRPFLEPALRGDQSIQLVVAANAMGIEFNKVVKTLAQPNILRGKSGIIGRLSAL